MRSPRKQSDPSLLIEVQGGDPGTWGCNEENSGKHLPRRGGGVARCRLRLLGLGSIYRNSMHKALTLVLTWGDSGVGLSQPG